MATIVRHICDACKKEVKESKDLYSVSIMDIVQYQLSAEVCTVSKDLCVDCYYELSHASLGVFFGTKKWLENN